MQREVELNADGTVDVEIDTAIAKEIHGDMDHRYEIVAEVRDQSRRTIVGTGSVLATRKPFKVFTWVDRFVYLDNSLGIGCLDELFDEILNLAFFCASLAETKEVDDAVGNRFSRNRVGHVIHLPAIGRKFDECCIVEPIND